MLASKYMPQLLKKQSLPCFQTYGKVKVVNQQVLVAYIMSLQWKHFNYINYGLRTITKGPIIKVHWWKRRFGKGYHPISCKTDYFSAKVEWNKLHLINSCTLSVVLTMWVTVSFAGSFDSHHSLFITLDRVLLICRGREVPPSYTEVRRTRTDWSKHCLFTRLKKGQGWAAAGHFSFKNKKFRHYPLTHMQIEGWVNFLHRENITTALEQNSVVSF